MRISLKNRVFMDSLSPMLLDDYTPAAAYSLRKIMKDYSGPAIKVRRASDNSELDIPFNLYSSTKHLALDQTVLSGFTNYSDLNRFPTIGVDTNFNGLSDGWGLTVSTGTNVFSINNGIQRIEHTNTSGTSQSIRFSVKTPNYVITSGDVITTTFNVRKVSGTAPVTVYLTPRNSGGTGLTSFITNITSTDFADYTVNYAMPATTVSYELFFQITSTSLNSTTIIEIQNVSVMNVKTSAFVTTWYDQSTNRRNATQITATNQPPIVLSGEILTDGSKPAITWPDTINSMALSSSSFTLCHFLFVTRYSNGSQSTWYRNYQGLFGGAALGSENIGFIAAFSGNTAYSSIVFYNAIRNNGNQFDIRSQVVLPMALQCLSLRHPTNISNSVIIGSDRTVADRGWSGPISEVIIFSSALTNDQVAFLQRNQGNYYNITVA